MLFGSKLSPLNMAGVVLATVGTYLCTAGKEAYNRAVPKSFTHGVTRKVASEIELTAWLVPGILASLTLTAVEMGGRMITTRFSADAGLFMQAQLAMCGLVSVVRLFRFPGGLINGLGLATRDPTRHHHNADPYVQGRQQWRQENWHQEGWRQAAWRQVPWYYNIVCVSPLAFSPNVVSGWASSTDCAWWVGQAGGLADEMAGLDRRVCAGGAEPRHRQDHHGRRRHSARDACRLRLLWLAADAREYRRGGDVHRWDVCLHNLKVPEARRRRGEGWRLYPPLL